MKKLGCSGGCGWHATKSTTNTHRIVAILDYRIHVRALAVACTLAACRFNFDAVDDIRDAATSGTSDAIASPSDGSVQSGDVASAGCPAGYTGIVTLTSRYRAIDNSETWLAAEALCEADGTHLVILDDNAEATYVIQLLTGQNVWLGVTDRVTVGTFRAVTGAPAPYLYWASGEPDATAPECVYMDGLTGRFADQDCASGRRPICECDGMAVDPSSY